MIERVFLALRRRTDVVGRFPGEMPALTLIWATLEQDRLNRRATELHASLKKTADDDGAQMAIGAILFWPALFFLEGGDGAEAAEYSRIKGEREAIEIAAIQRDCSIATAQETPKVEAETKPDS